MREKTIYNRLNKVYTREYGDSMCDQWYANPNDQLNIWMFHRPSTDMTVLMELSEDGKKVTITESFSDREKVYVVKVWKEK